MATALLQIAVEQEELLGLVLNTPNIVACHAIADCLKLHEQAIELRKDGKALMEEGETANDNDKVQQGKLLMVRGEARLREAKNLRNNFVAQGIQMPQEGTISRKNGRFKLVVDDDPNSRSRLKHHQHGKPFVATNDWVSTARELIITNNIQTLKRFRAVWNALNYYTNLEEMMRTLFPSPQQAQAARQAQPTAHPQLQAPALLMVENVDADDEDAFAGNNNNGNGRAMMPARAVNAGDGAMTGFQPQQGGMNAAMYFRGDNNAGATFTSNTNNYAGATVHISYNYHGNDSAGNGNQSNNNSNMNDNHNHSNGNNNNNNNNGNGNNNNNNNHHNNNDLDTEAVAEAVAAKVANRLAPELHEIQQSVRKAAPGSAVHGKGQPRARFDRNERGTNLNDMFDQMGQEQDGEVKAGAAEPVAEDVQADVEPEQPTASDSEPVVEVEVVDVEDPAPVEPVVQAAMAEPVLQAEGAEVEEAPVLVDPVPVAPAVEPQVEVETVDEDEDADVEDPAAEEVEPIVQAAMAEPVLQAPELVVAAAEAQGPVESQGLFTLHPDYFQHIYDNMDWDGYRMEVNDATDLQRIVLPTKDNFNDFKNSDELVPEAMVVTSPSSFVQIFVNSLTNGEPTESLGSNCMVYNTGHVRDVLVFLTINETINEQHTDSSACEELEEFNANVQALGLPYQMMPDFGFKNDNADIDDDVVFNIVAPATTCFSPIASLIGQHVIPRLDRLTKVTWPGYLPNKVITDAYFTPDSIAAMGKNASLTDIHFQFLKFSKAQLKAIAKLPGSKIVHFEKCGVGHWADLFADKDTELSLKVTDCKDPRPDLPSLITAEGEGEGEYSLILDGVVKEMNDEQHNALATELTEFIQAFWAKKGNDVAPNVTVTGQALDDTKLVIGCSVLSTGGAPLPGNIVLDPLSSDAEKGAFLKSLRTLVLDVFDSSEWKGWQAMADSQATIVYLETRVTGGPENFYKFDDEDLAAAKMIVARAVQGGYSVCIGGESEQGCSFILKGVPCVRDLREARDAALIERDGPPAPPSPPTIVAVDEDHDKENVPLGEGTAVATGNPKVDSDEIPPGLSPTVPSVMASATGDVATSAPTANTAPEVGSDGPPSDVNVAATGSESPMELVDGAQDSTTVAAKDKTVGAAAFSGSVVFKGDTFRVDGGVVQVVDKKKSKKALRPCLTCQKKGGWENCTVKKHKELYSHHIGGN